MRKKNEQMPVYRRENGPIWFISPLRNKGKRRFRKSFLSEIVPKITFSAVRNSINIDSEISNSMANLSFGTVISSENLERTPYFTSRPQKTSILKA